MQQSNVWVGNWSKFMKRAKENYENHHKSIPFATLLQSHIHINQNLKQQMEIPDQYGNPGLLTVLVDFRPRVLDHHPLLVSQWARTLQVVHLSLLPLHLETQCGSRLSTCNWQRGRQALVALPLPQNKHVFYLLLFLLSLSHEKKRDKNDLFTLSKWESLLPTSEPLLGESVWVRSRMRKTQETHTVNEEEPLLVSLFTLSFPTLHPPCYILFLLLSTLPL